MNAPGSCNHLHQAGSVLQRENPMVRDLVRNFVNFILWLGIAIGCIILNIIVILSNYLGCRTSFELMGFEMMPLYEDDLLGRLFGAFLGNATMAHLFALSVTLANAFGIFILTEQIFCMFSNVRDRRHYRQAIENPEESEEREENEANAQQALKRIVRNLVIIVLFAVPIALACRWDINLFLFRYYAGALGIEDPQLAASTVTSQDLQLSEFGNLFVWSVARISACGYVSVTAIASMGFAFCLLKLGEFYERMHKSLRQVIHPEAQPRDDVDNLVQDHSSSVRDTEYNPETGGDTVWIPEAATEPVQTAHDTSSDSDTEQDVIGSTESERVTRDQANSDPRYRVDPATGYIWLADYRNKLYDD